MLFRSIKDLDYHHISIDKTNVQFKACATAKVLPSSMFCFSDGGARGFIFAKDTVEELSADDTGSMLDVILSEAKIDIARQPRSKQLAIKHK